MSRLAALIGFAAVATVFLASPRVARAECPYFPIPPATEAARSARELIVGTVVENVGGQMDDFRLRVDRVLRGSAHVGDVRRVSFLYPGWPPEVNADGTVFLDEQGHPVMPCAPIPAWKGNVIVLALGALAPDGRTRYNAASWISGGLPFATDTPRTTLAEIERLAGAPDTATAGHSERPTGGPGDGRLATLLLGSLLGIVAIGRWRRVRHGASHRQLRTPPAH